MRHSASRVGCRRLLALVVAVLPAGAGLCLFDADHDGDDAHAGTLDLCLGMLAASFVLPLLAGLSESGRAALAEMRPPSPIALSVPAPPPRPTILA